MKFKKIPQKTNHLFLLIIWCSDQQNRTSMLNLYTTKHSIPTNDLTMACVDTSAITCIDKSKSTKQRIFNVSRNSPALVGMYRKHKGSLYLYPCTSIQV